LDIDEGFAHSELLLYERFGRGYSRVLEILDSVE
jgi:hypothetical protein